VENRLTLYIDVQTQPKMFSGNFQTFFYKFRTLAKVLNTFKMILEASGNFKTILKGLK